MRQVTVRGKLIKSFNGIVTDDNGTNEFQPSWTLVNYKTGSMHKIKVTKADFEKYSVMQGKTIEVAGLEEKPEKVIPAEIQADELKEVAAGKWKGAEVSGWARSAQKRRAKPDTSEPPSVLRG